MKKEQLRIHALDVALRLNPAPSSTADLFKMADEIANYIDKPLVPIGHIWTTADIVDYQSCAADVKRFAEKCSILHPIRGSLKFKPFSFQYAALDLFQNNKYSILLKSRQMGLSTCSSMYALWKAIFQPNTTIMLGASSFAMARDMMDRIRTCIDGLPPHLKPVLLVRQKDDMQFENGSRILARAASDSMMRGMGVDLLILDELAYLGDSRAQTMWTAIQPVLASGRTSQVIIASSAGRQAGLFYNIWQGANPVGANGTGSNGFAPLELPWWRHPERDQTWAQPFIRSLGQDRFDQEFSCQFAAV